MRAVLVGPLAAKSKINLKRSDLLIAVDGGVDHCARLGLRPKLAVGDWDSIKSPKLLEQVRHVTLPRAKEGSDLAFAILEAKRMGARELVGYGFNGGRPDHELASLAEMSAASSLGFTSVGLVGEAATYHFMSPQVPRWSGQGLQGSLISVFSLSGPVTGLTLRGFEFELSGARLGLSSQGLSNIVKSPRCEIRLKKGRLVVIIPYGDRKPPRSSSARAHAL